MITVRAVDDSRTCTIGIVVAVTDGQPGGPRRALNETGQWEDWPSNVEAPLAFCFGYDIAEEVYKALGTLYRKEPAEIQQLRWDYDHEKERVDKFIDYLLKDEA